MVTDPGACDLLDEFERDGMPPEVILAGEAYILSRWKVNEYGAA
jgi:hypothetical protein